MMEKNFKTLQDCLFWLRYHLPQKSFYLGMPKIFQVFGETDIPYEYDSLFCYRIRKKIELHVNEKLRFTVTPLPKRMFFGISNKKGRDYMILFIPYPTYEKALIDNVLLGFNFPREGSFEYNYQLLRDYLKRHLTPAERREVLGRV